MPSAPEPAPFDSSGDLLCLAETRPDTGHRVYLLYEEDADYSSTLKPLLLHDTERTVSFALLCDNGLDYFYDEDSFREWVAHGTGFVTA